MFKSDTIKRRVTEIIKERTNNAEVEYAEAKKVNREIKETAVRQAEGDELTSNEKVVTRLVQEILGK